MATPITPVGKRIVVKPIEAEEKTKSGIIIAGGSKEKPAQGTVVAVGEKLEGVKVGDTVVFAKYGYDEVVVGAHTYCVVKHDDVVAVVK